MTFDEDAARVGARDRSRRYASSPRSSSRRRASCRCRSNPTSPAWTPSRGTSLYTSRWPAEGFDFTGKRVGVIGTGSTGVQLIPVVAREAGHLTVFQRSPAFTLPWQVRPFEPGELDELKANYPEIRAAQREHPVGAARLSRVLGADRHAEPTADQDRASARSSCGPSRSDGVMGALDWGDIFFDIEANRMATALYGEAIARIVKDPETAAALVPTHPFALQAPDHRPGLLRDVQPRQRHPRRPAQRTRSRGDSRRESRPSRAFTSST